MLLFSFFFFLLLHFLSSADRGEGGQKESEWGGISLSRNINAGSDDLRNKCSGSNPRNISILFFHYLFFFFCCLILALSTTRSRQSMLNTARQDVCVFFVTVTQAGAFAKLTTLLRGATLEPLWAWHVFLISLAQITERLATFAILLLLMWPQTGHPSAAGWWLCEDGVGTPPSEPSSPLWHSDSVEPKVGPRQCCLLECYYIKRGNTFNVMTNSNRLQRQKKETNSKNINKVNVDS